MTEQTNLTRALGVLKDMESDGATCPICGNWDFEPHKGSCSLGRAIQWLEQAVKQEIATRSVFTQILEQLEDFDEGWDYAYFDLGDLILKLKPIMEKIAKG